MGEKTRTMHRAALSLLLLAGISAGTAARAQRPVLATVTIVPAELGICTTRWNGEAVTDSMLQSHAVKALMEAIQRAGGVQNLTEETVPVIRVEAPAETSYACAEPALYALSRAGFPGILLLPLGEARGPSALEFSWPDTGSERTTQLVTMGPAGRLTWNGARTDLAGLTAHARAAAAGMEAEMAPGDLLILPEPASTFGEIYEVVRTLRDAGAVPTLALMSS